MSTLIDRITDEQAREAMLELRAANKAVARTRELLRRQLRHRDGLVDQLDAHHTARLERGQWSDRLLGDIVTGRNGIDDARTPADHAAAVRAYEAGV